MIKKSYEEPCSELLIVRFEENIMSPTGERFNKQTGEETMEDWE